MDHVNDNVCVLEIVKEVDIHGDPLFARANCLALTKYYCRFRSFGILACRLHITCISHVIYMVFPPASFLSSRL